MEKLAEIFDAVDQAFAKVQELHPDEVRCGRGCDDCCHAVFDISLVEAVNLYVSLTQLPQAVQDQIRVSAEVAWDQWQHIITLRKDPARERIRCPLLGKEGLCLCYEARPINCRTYGIPTVIGGKGHVCGLSGFAPGQSYPTVNIEALQQILFGMSVDLAGTERGRLRWPIAAVVLGSAGIEDLVKTAGN